MNVVVRGRNVEVPDHFRTLVTEKLAKAERLDGRLQKVDVELLHERNPRQSAVRQRVEITCATQGSTIRAEAGAADFQSALDLAVNKLESRLRRSTERRRDHQRPTHRTSGVPTVLAPEDASGATGSVNGRADHDGHHDLSAEDDGPGRIVRMKDHVAEPMGIDDALFRMELVGHDFYLFSDEETGLPSVVYRRKGYDYGLIRLSTA